MDDSVESVATEILSGDLPIDEAARRASPGLLAQRLMLRVMRPTDHLVFVVSAIGCEVVVGADRVPRLKPIKGFPEPRLVVTLPPQHVLEQVLQSKQGGNGPDMGKPEKPDLPLHARFAGPSRLAFALSSRSSVTMTVNGILRAMGRLPLAVVPLAEPRFVWHAWDALTTPQPARLPDLVLGGLDRAGAAAAQSVLDRVRATRTLVAAGLGRDVVALDPSARQELLTMPADDRAQFLGNALVRPERAIDLSRVFIGRPAPRPATGGETAIELPSRLQLSPSQLGAWAHSTGVDDAPGTTVELWNTRLGVRAGTSRHPGVDETNTEQRVVRAVWTRDMEHGAALPSPDWPFRYALSPEDRKAIVEQSTGDAGTSWLLPPPAPVGVNLLALTALGAFTDVRGNWDTGFLAEWQHRTTLGRDQFVRVVKRGYLCPFGHRATLISETRRRADPTMPGSGYAILWQRFYIVIKEHVRQYDGRDMPFVQVTIDPKTTPDINDPGLDPRVFWPMIGSKAFAFTIRAVDQDGNQRSYYAPLLFVAIRSKELPVPSNHDVYLQYGLTDDGLHDIAGSPYQQLVRHGLGDKRVAVAAKGASGEACYNTRTLRFTARLADDTCTPALLFGEFVIPAVAAATGRKEALNLSYDPTYVQHGFDAGHNRGEVVFVSNTSAELKFDSSDRSGGFLNPSQHIAGIARGSGPVSDVHAATTGTPANPADLFAGMGKLLGLFELSDILQELGLSDIPAYASQLLDVVGALTGGLSRAVDHLGSHPAAAQLKAAASALDTLIHQTPTPTADDFANFLTTTLGPAVTAALQRSVLDTLGKAAAALVERALRTVDDVINAPGVDVPEVMAAIAAGRPIANALNHVHLEWRPPIKSWPGTSSSDAIFLPGDPRSLLLAVDVRGGDLVTQPSVEVLAELTDFTLQLLPGIPLLHIPFRRLYFRATSGAKTEIDVALGELEWLGVLGFVDKLRQLIPSDGFSDPPSVTVDSTGIGAGFSLVLPNVAVGVFNLSNMSMAADVKLPFIGDAPTVGFSFCSRERPFTVAVLFLGGGGFFGLRLSPKEVVLIEAAIEFGATLALDFGVASGSVSCMAGVYLRLEAGNGSLTGYLRIRGEVDVLGLISASIEMYMGLTYNFGSGKVIGEATITVEVEVLFFSASVSISAQRQFAGSKGDPTFADALGPYTDPDCPWISYCQAFAEV